MKIVTIIDKPKSAIDILAQSVKKHNPHWDITIQPLHPKRPDPHQINAVKKALEECDLADVQYWKSGAKIKELFPELWANTRKILTHHNPYDLHKEKWEDYKAVVVKNETQHTNLPNSTVIFHTVDLDFFKFNREYTDNTTVLMVAARIEGKKGIKEVAQACQELGYKFILVGRISKKGYFDQIMEVNPETDFREDITEEELKEAYYESAILVCNSVDEFESGPMPVLEAMACGVPVLTRDVGLIPDIYDGRNLEIRQGPPDDVAGMKHDLRELMLNPALRERRRGNGWGTVKNRGHERAARMYSKLFYRHTGGGKPLVSIIIPTYNRPEQLVDVMVAASIQEYPCLEIVVADSGESVEKIVDSFRNEIKIPIKYIHFQREGYTLAEARNRAVIESEGDLLVFCDDRLKMDKMAVKEFVTAIQPVLKSWVWGAKDGYEKGFVENFSCIRRKEFIEAGMFNERMDRYGGMTQEVRTRFQKQGFSFGFCRTANARSIAKSGSRWQKRDDVVASKLKLYKLYG